MKLQIEDLAALEAAYPQCVRTETKVVKRAHYENIRAALKLYGTVPGVRVVTDAEPTNSEADETTEFHRKLKAKS
jgi:hypothetical protein